MNNKSYRIRTEVGKDKFLHVKLDQDYDSFEILSLKVNKQGDYLTHSADYGVVIGRVIANGGIGVPNAKLSIFVPRHSGTDELLYPYKSVFTTNEDNIRYNLLPNQKVDDCHQPVGSFPSKRYLLDNDGMVEVFDEYYKYSTKTNDSGDYMLFGIPTGNYILHMDLDISDCGHLSQRPRDFFIKGYTKEQFESANQFKKSTQLDTLAQIFSQNESVEVRPFWGDESDSNLIGITRADINVNFKFESTCVFLGSVFTDDASNGIKRNCTPSKEMGKMNKLVTGAGTIEMIRKKADGSIEEFQIQGTELIESDGTWCYQIPMNLDYMITDEYGNLVATDNPERGIATRAKVRFRVSMHSEKESGQYFQAKMLVPNHPSNDYEYADTFNFGSNTPENEFRDLFKDCVYSVKSYIPRIQKVHKEGTTRRTKKFTGFKTVNKYDGNNPIPYNHLRIRFPFLYSVVCWMVKQWIKIHHAINRTITTVQHFIWWLRNLKIPIINVYPFKKVKDIFSSYKWITSELCEDLDGVFLIPGSPIKEENPHWDDREVKALIDNTYRSILKSEYLFLEEPQEDGPDDEVDLKDGEGYELISEDQTDNIEKIYGYMYLKRKHDWGYVFARFVLLDRGYTLEDMRLSGDTLKPVAVFVTRNVNKGKVIGNEPDSSLLDYTYNRLADGEGDDIGFDFTGYKGTTSKKDPPYLPNNPYVTQNKIKEAMKGGKRGTLEDRMSMEYNGKEVMANNGSFGDDPEANEALINEKICLAGNEEYLMECIEMQLAEEYEVINFDFYNDWLNGCLYMPRWKRKVKLKKRNGEIKKIKACSTDNRKRNGKVKNKRLYIGSVGDIHFESSAGIVAPVSPNYTKKMWKRGDYLKLKTKTNLIYAHKTNLDDIVYYYTPLLEGKNIFATDIILLGALGDCNLFGIPSVSDSLPSSTYKIPSDLAETTYTNNDETDDIDGGACISIGAIRDAQGNDVEASVEYPLYYFYYGLKTLEELFPNATGYLKELVKSNESEDEFPGTEEAGISWNYTGPNQTTKDSIIKPRDQVEAAIYDPYMIYAPGGHFLGLACGARNTLTNVRSSYNLIRACELGVTLSEKVEGLCTWVPNGLITNMHIDDRTSRNLFASLNYTNLATTIDSSTGYLRYKPAYVFAGDFDGGFIDFSDSEKVKAALRQRGRLFKAMTCIPFKFNEVVEIDDDGGAAFEGYSETLYSLITEGATLNDYIMFRYGGGPNIAQESGGHYNVFPQYENSFYFYFGLNNGSTAIDKFRATYFAVCGENEELEYEGYASTVSGKTLNDEVISLTTLNGVGLPYEIRINEGSGNLLDTNEWFGLYYVRSAENTDVDDAGYLTGNTGNESLIKPISVKIGDETYQYTGQTLINPASLILHFDNGVDIDVAVNGEKTVCTYNNTEYTGGNTLEGTYKSQENEKMIFNWNMSSFREVDTIFFGIVKPEGNINIEIKSSDGHILSQDQAGKGKEFDSKDFNVIPFYNKEGKANIETPRFATNNAGDNDYIGGCITVNLSPSELRQYKIYLKGKETIVYGGGSENDKYIIPDGNISRLPVTTSGKWTVNIESILGTELNETSIVKNVNVEYTSNGGNIRVGNLDVDNRKWYTSNTDYVTNNLTQYSYGCVNPIDLKLQCSVSGAKLVFLGQGEISDINVKDNLDTSYPYGDGYENRDVANNRYFLSSNRVYIPTMGYTNGNGIKRNNFEFAYYNTNGDMYTPMVSSAKANDVKVETDENENKVISSPLFDLSQYKAGEHCLLRVKAENTSLIGVYYGMVINKNSLRIYGAFNADSAGYYGVYEMFEVPVDYHPQGANVYIALNKVGTKEVKNDDGTSETIFVNKDGYEDGALNAVVHNSIENGKDTTSLTLTVGGVSLRNTKRDNVQEISDTVLGSLKKIDFSNADVSINEKIGSNPNIMNVTINKQKDYRTDTTWEEFAKKCDGSGVVVNNQDGKYKITEYYYEDSVEHLKITIAVYTLV